MAKAAPKTAVAETKAKKGADPRTMSLEQRRESFLLLKKEQSKNDWHVLKDDEVEEKVPYNFITLDHVLRLYGMVGRGSVIEIHGDEGAGKSTLAYCINREYQRATGEPIVYFDFERTTTVEYLSKLGLDMNMAFVVRPDTMEDSVKELLRFIKAGVRMFTFDSIPRMKSKVDEKNVMNGKAFGNQPGQDALMMKKFYDVVLPYISGADGRLLMVNQTRSRIEMTQEAASAAKGYSTITNLNYSLPGGKAHRFAVSVMLELTLQKAYKPGKHEDEFVLEAEAKNGEQYLANQVRIRSLKNKVTGTGYREGHIWIRPGFGVDESISVREIARQYKLIAAHGKKWFIGNSYEDALHVFEDKASAIESLVTNPDPEIMVKLRDLVISRLQVDDSQFMFDMDDEASRYLAGEANEGVEEVDHSMTVDLVDVDEDI